MSDYTTPRLATWRKWTDGPLLVLAIGSLPLLLLEIDRHQLASSRVDESRDRRESGLALIPGLGGVGSIRALRASRALRSVAVLLRVMAIGGASAHEGRTLIRKHAARFALGFAGLTWITAAVGFTLAEDVGAHGRVHSFFDAVWWAAATITTVGYGDISPVTVAGRLIGIATMFIGIGAFAVVTAKVAEFLVRSGREDAAERAPSTQ